MMVNGDTWLLNIRQELYNIGLGYIWESNVVDNTSFIIIKNRLCDIFQQKCQETISSSPKGHIFQYLTNVFTLQNYIVKVNNRQFQKELTRIRTSSHKLNIENGRFRNIVRNERKCTKCNLEEIEDEYHFVIACPFYQEIRQNLIKPYYRKKPSVYKFIQLLCTSNVTDLNNLGKYLLKANKLRETI